jgi:alkylation response protein AidB-like acyl-CoA dehydrogenase
MRLQSRQDGRTPLRRLGAGLLAGALPRTHGGGSATALCEAAIKLGESSGDGGLALAWAGHALGCGLAIGRLGDERQRQRYLPALSTGTSIGAWAHDERAIAGDRVGVQTTARRRGDGWILRGRKTWVIGAAIADIFVVTARGEAGKISSFIVERDAPGCRVGPRIATTGAGAAAIADLVLDDCELGPHGLLGGEGTGLSHTCRLVRRWQRGLGLAPWVGLLRGALALALAHAREFVRLGAPLAASQALRARLADLQIRLALCERVQARSAWLLDHADAGGERELAAGRLFLAESVATSVREAAAICAPQALAPDHPLARLVADAPFLDRLDVDADTLRSIVAGSLLGLG